MDFTRRFSSRVSDYLRYRPSYPKAFLDHLTHSGILTPSSTIADIGSGTGLLAELFLTHGNSVFGIEPNAEMRQAGEHQLKSFPSFTSINATAESTTLPEASIDLVAAGQAFHWFDRERVREEFRRILRPPGWVALIWNERRTDTPFLSAYEEFLRTFAMDYSAVDHRQMTADIIRAFYTPHPMTLAIFKNSQTFDFTGLKGRVFSSSYSPEPGHPQHAPMLAALAQLYRQHAVNDQVRFEYKTQLYTGHLHELANG